MERDKTWWVAGKRWEEGGRGEDELPACLLPQQQVWPTSFAGLKNTNTHTHTVGAIVWQRIAGVHRLKQKEIARPYEILQTLITTSSRGVLRPTPWTKSRQKELSFSPCYFKVTSTASP